MRNEPFRIDPQIYKTNQPNPMCFSYNLSENNVSNFGNMPRNQSHGGAFNGPYEENTVKHGSDNVNNVNQIVKKGIDRHG